jgi:hypothetical protein
VRRPPGTHNLLLLALLRVRVGVLLRLVALRFDSSVGGLLGRVARLLLVADGVGGGGQILLQIFQTVRVVNLVAGSTTSLVHKHNKFNYAFKCTIQNL